MKEKSENLIQQVDLESTNFSGWVFKLRNCLFYSVLLFCVTTQSIAESSSELLDPINFLIENTAKTIKDTKSASLFNHIELPQVTKEQKGLQTSSNSKTKITDLQPKQIEPKQPKNKLPEPPKNQITQSDINAVKFVANPDPNFSQNDSANIQNIQAAQQLWQEDISSPKSSGEISTQKNELQKIIKQIRSVELKPRKEKPQKITIIEPTAMSHPDGIKTNSNEPNETTLINVESDLPYELIKEQTLQMLEEPQYTEKINNPFEMAEVLYLSQNLTKAGFFYQQALNKTDPNEPENDQNRAWILFQIGNCLRDTKPQTSVEMYTQLISDYPDSPWTDLAKTRKNIIDLYQEKKPQNLIDKKNN